MSTDFRQQVVELEIQIRDLNDEINKLAGSLTEQGSKLIPIVTLLSQSPECVKLGSDTIPVSQHCGRNSIAKSLGEAMELFDLPKLNERLFSLRQKLNERDQLQIQLETAETNRVRAGV